MTKTLAIGSIASAHSTNKGERKQAPSQAGAPKPRGTSDSTSALKDARAGALERSDTSRRPQKASIDNPLLEDSHEVRAQIKEAMENLRNAPPEQKHRSPEDIRGNAQRSMGMAAAKYAEWKHLSSDQMEKDVRIDIKPTGTMKGAKPGEGAQITERESSLLERELARYKEDGKLTTEEYGLLIDARWYYAGDGTGGG